MFGIGIAGLFIEDKPGRRRLILGGLGGPAGASLFFLAKYQFLR